MRRALFAMMALPLALAAASCQPTLQDGVYGCADDAGCPSGWRCVLGAGAPGDALPGRCAQSAAPTTPCRSDADCGNDSLACNGTITCGPVGAVGADARGCVAGVAPCDRASCSDTPACCSDDGCSPEPCVTDADCPDDMLACNGRARCDASLPTADARGCNPATPIVCEPTLACTEPAGTCAAPPSRGIRFVNLRDDGPVTFVYDGVSVEVEARQASSYVSVESTVVGASADTIVASETLNVTAPPDVFITVFAVPHYDPNSYEPGLVALDLRSVTDPTEGVQLVNALDQPTDMYVELDDAGGMTYGLDLPADDVASLAPRRSLRRVRPRFGVTTLPFAQFHSVSEEPVTVFLSGRVDAHPQDPQPMRSLWLTSTLPTEATRSFELYAFDGRSVPPDRIVVCSTAGEPTESGLMPGVLAGPLFVDGTATLHRESCTGAPFSGSLVTSEPNGRAIVVAGASSTAFIHYETRPALEISSPGMQMSMRAWNLRGGTVSFEVRDDTPMAVYIESVETSARLDFAAVDLFDRRIDSLRIDTMTATEADIVPRDNYLTLLATPGFDVAVFGPRGGPLRARSIRP